MSEYDKDQRLLNCTLLECNSTIPETLNLPGDGSPLLLTGISLVYCTVSAAGVLGNILVLFLLLSSRTARKSSINVFVFNLAITNLLFSFALPFFAVELALDYHWPFGLVMCKLVSMMMSLNVYANAFFLTAMSITRYCTLAAALGGRRPAGKKVFKAMVVAGLIWAFCTLVALPPAIFAGLNNIAHHADVCLFHFPNTDWLAIHHLMRVILGFIVPYAILTIFYSLLLCFLFRHQPSGLNPQRQTRVTMSVVVVILSFCICWLPNNIFIIWKALMNLGVVEFSFSYYFTNTYIFPILNCLAHVNSCLNPVIYCLIRREYRSALCKLLRWSSFSSLSKMCLSMVNYTPVETDEERFHVPLNNVGSNGNTLIPSTTLSIIHTPQSTCPLNA